AAPVPHTWFSATIPCQGSIIPVAIIIKLYNTAAKKMAKMISIKALFDEKLNYSAACGTLSKPTNANGAMATMEMIAANAVVSDANNGCRFSKPVPGLALTIKVIATILTTITVQKTNCIRPDKLVPFILK